MDLLRYDTVQSTSDLLKTLADDGAAEWTAVLSRSQTRGRGRLGRHWYSPPGNFYLSILLRPSILPADLPKLSLIAALAVFETLHGEETSLQLKWPNDILLDGRKLAGVLPEARTRGEEVEYVVLGIGINLKAPPVGLPEELSGKAAFLDELGEVIDEESILEGLESNLRRYCMSFGDAEWEDVQARWRKYADWEREYSIQNSGSRYVGRPLGLNRDGSLLLATSEGNVTLTSGELTDVVGSARTIGKG